jgi:hypothetical protein
MRAVPNSYLQQSKMVFRTNMTAEVSYTRESKKLSALLFFQFIYTKVGVEQVRHFST